VSRTYFATRRMLAASLILTILLAPLAAAQVIVAPKIKGKLVDVIIRDGSIQMPAVVEEGWVTFRITNAGRDNHSLSAMGRKKIHALAIAIPPGATVFLPIKLKEGVYTVWCPMEDHARSGESVALTVVDD
jgi:hypothetical protein